MKIINHVSKSHKVSPSKDSSFQSQDSYTSQVQCHDKLFSKSNIANV